MRAERLIYSALILIAALTAIFNWRRAILLRADNEELRQKIELLESEAASSGNLAEIARNQSERLRKQTSELMQLRNEVTRIRAESKQMDTFVTENQRLKAELAQLRSTPDPREPAGTNAGAAQRFPRESWSFAGYASPEAALVSAIWAMKEGKPQSYLDSLAPAEQQRMAQVWQGKSADEIAEKHKSDVAAISGIRVLQQDTVAAGEMVMNVVLEGLDRVEKIRMNQVGQEWKFGGFIREEPVP